MSSVLTDLRHRHHLSHNMSDETPNRDELASMYFDQLPYEPYPVQEEALLTWFTAKQGVLVCAPTGMGKTLIAEAALFEALHTGKIAYYTTPLIALTDQKFREMQASAARWGFSPDDVGLVTGNRRVNPEARVLVVVAEILFNRLLHSEAFDFTDVSAVVMDEFHSFADAERGIVWEFSLGLLPAHVRTLLLSATVGNSQEFANWLRAAHDRRVEIVESDQRRVPLAFEWVGDTLLADQITAMANADPENRRTPTLIFCFNRDQCWDVAEMLKGKKLLADGQQKELSDRLATYDLSQGAGPKLKQILQRGVGVHHAGILPNYKRIVEELFQEKLLTVTVCTETLASGINLPARSIVLPTLLKGPPDKKKLIEPSSAHQIFGRAGRPQFDTQGFVYALAHEDDVKILRWQEKYDQIPEGTKDLGLMKAKKALKKKMPKRRTTQQYWTAQQFEKLRISPPGHLQSRGAIPWRMLAYMVEASPEVETIRNLASRRLLESARVADAQQSVDRMLVTLWRGGFVRLEPEPTGDTDTEEKADDAATEDQPPPRKLLTAADLTFGGGPATGSPTAPAEKTGPPTYRAERAFPTPELEKLSIFRGVNPLYGIFLIHQLGIADRAERLQALESVLAAPGSVARHVRVPRQWDLPPGPLATGRLDAQLLRLGLATEDELVEPEQQDSGPRKLYDEEKKWVLPLADKLKLLFDHDFPGVHGVRIVPVWIAGELIEFGGEFNKYITTKGLQKQEGMLFRHLLRLILLIGEVRQISPAEVAVEDWQQELDELSVRLAESCRNVDPTSTDKTLEQVESK